MSHPAPSSSTTPNITIPFEHVSDTAFLVSAFRLLERTQEHPLFDDRLASKLLGGREAEMLERGKIWKLGTWTMAIRTALIDQKVLQWVGEGVTTIVNVAAGLDLRPYRLPLPSQLNWIEVDYPALIDFKAEKLQEETPNCNLRRLRVDLANPKARSSFLEELQNLGKFAVITEGLLMYLDPSDVQGLSNGFLKCKNLTGWISDSISASALKAFHEDQGILQDEGPQKKNPGQGVEFKFLPEEGLWYFEKLGWKISEFHPYHIAGPRLGRPAPSIGKHSMTEEMANKVGIGVLTRNTNNQSSV